MAAGAIDGGGAASPRRGRRRRRGVGAPATASFAPARPPTARRRRARAGTPRPAPRRRNAVEPLDGIGEDEACPRLGTPLLDVDDYELTSTTTRPPGELDGRRPSGPTPTRATPTEVELDFQGLRSMPSRSTATTSTSRGDKLRHRPGRASIAGSELTIVVDYSGVPEPVPTEALGGVEVGWHGGEDGLLRAQRARGRQHLVPGEQPPARQGHLHVRVTVPEPYSAIANGALLSTGPDDDAGTTTFEWRMDAPMASYLASVVTGDFYEVDGGEHDGVAYSYWYPHGYEPVDDARGSRRARRPLADKLGPVPVRDLRRRGLPAVVHRRRRRDRAVPVRRRARDPGSVALRRGLHGPSVVLHEAAHQWMGDNVSITDWSRDIWWVEGFAHFAEYVDDPDQLAELYPQIRSQLAAARRPPDRRAVLRLLLRVRRHRLLRPLPRGGRGVVLGHPARVQRPLLPGQRVDRRPDRRRLRGQRRDLEDFFDAWLFDETPPKLPA